MVQLIPTSLHRIPLSLIDEWEHNPRKNFEPSKIAALAENLRAVGQHEAVIVRVHPENPDRYQLANGARRLRASKIAQLEAIEARVRELSDAQMWEIALSTGSGENTEPLSPLEEAQGYADAMQSLGLTQREVALKFGSSQTHVSERVALLSLSPRSRKLIEERKVALTVAVLVARISDPEAREKGEQDVLIGPVIPLTYESALKHVRSTIYKPLGSAPFKQEDATLSPAAGACTVCPHNTASNGEMFHGVKSACMKPSCFDEKVAKARQLLLQAETAKGKKQLTPEENAAVFKDGGNGVEWNSEFAELARPVPRDLLKSEVQTAPKWRDMISEECTVYVGCDQQNRVVDLVKLQEALMCVPQDELPVFKDEVRRKFNVGALTSEPADSAVGSAPAAAPVASAPAAPKGSTDSRRAEESQAEKDRKASARVTAKREKEVLEWLETLEASINERTDGDFNLWTLLFDLGLAALSNSDLEFFAKLIGDELEFEPGAGALRSQIEDYAGGLEASAFPGLVAVLLLVPRARAEGLESALVKEWHATFVAEKAK